MAGPSLSVVVVTVYGSVYLEPCLLALESQSGAPEDLEIIVVYNRNKADIHLLKDRFPKARFFYSPDRQTQNALRGWGVEQATGRIVAVTVDHCTAERNWCHRILTEHERAWAAIGGAVDKGTQPGTLTNWAVHIYDYCNYGTYLRPFNSGPSHDLSDCNVTYKREVLESMADAWRDDFNVALLNKALLTRGETLWLSPELIVYQNRDIPFERASWVAYQRGRVFATARLEDSSEGRRIYYALFSPLLPGILLSRLAKNLFRKTIHYRKIFLTLPLIILLMLLWSWGEMITHLTLQRKITLPTAEE
jgi:hypothetical protein